MKTQSYGGLGRKSADPSPAELRKRIREVHAMRKQEQREQSQPQRQRFAAIKRVLRREGAATSSQIARRFGLAAHSAYEDLQALSAIGVVDRIGAGNALAYRLADDDTVCSLPSAETILAKFRAKGAAKVAAHRVSPVRTRPLSAA